MAAAQTLPEPEGAPPSTPLRENLIDVIREKMEHFYQTAYLSEMWLLLDGLSFSETSRGATHEMENDECPLAEMLSDRLVRE